MTPKSKSTIAVYSVNCAFMTRQLSIGSIFFFLRGITQNKSLLYTLVPWKKNVRRKQESGLWCSCYVLMCFLFNGKISISFHS